MEMRDFLVMLQYEVQRSFDFIDDVKNPAGQAASVLHIAMEKVEVELPVVFSSKEVTYTPESFKDIDTMVKRLRLPYHDKTVIDKQYLPRKPILGKTLEVEIIGPQEKLDDSFAPELVGKIKVVMKPIIK